MISIMVVPAASERELDGEKMVRVWIGLCEELEANHIKGVHSRRSSRMAFKILSRTIINMRASSARNIHEHSLFTYTDLTIDSREGVSYALNSKQHLYLLE